MHEEDTFVELRLPEQATLRLRKNLTLEQWQHILEYQQAVVPLQIQHHLLADLPSVGSGGPYFRTDERRDRRDDRRDDRRGGLRRGRGYGVVGDRSRSFDDFPRSGGTSTTSLYGPNTTPTSQYGSNTTPTSQYGPNTTPTSQYGPNTTPTSQYGPNTTSTHGPNSSPTSPHGPSTTKPKSPVSGASSPPPPRSDPAPSLFGNNTPLAHKRPASPIVTGAKAAKVSRRTPQTKEDSGTEPETETKPSRVNAGIRSAPASTKTSTLTTPAKQFKSSYQSEPPPTAKDSTSTNDGFSEDPIWPSSSIKLEQSFIDLTEGDA